MRHSSLVRLLPWLLISVCPPLLGHCGGSTEPGTETGNPPVVEQQRLHIVLRDTGVEVVGDPGAVTAGASVQLTNRRTGDHAEATARADGSVSVSVPGSLQDEYEVTVATRGGSQTVRVTTTSGDTSSAGSAGVGPGDTGASDAELASASCSTLESTLRQRVSAGFSGGDTACRVDDDCVFQGWGVGCYFQCGSSFLSVNGAALAQAQVQTDTAPVCNELTSRCTREPPFSCAPVPTTTPECANGVCRGLDLSALGCDELANTASSRLNSLLDTADHGCARDSDCTLYDPSLACVADCGRPTALATQALPDLTGRVEQLEERFCAEFENRSCPGPFQLPCPPPLMTPKASCVSGQCSVTSTPYGP
jgi:hypothetical protein